MVKELLHSRQTNCYHLLPFSVRMHALLWKLTWTARVFFMRVSVVRKERWGRGRVEKGNTCRHIISRFLLAPDFSLDQNTSSLWNTTGTLAPQLSENEYSASTNLKFQMWVNDKPVDGGYMRSNQVNEIPLELQMETILMLMISEALRRYLSSSEREKWRNSGN